MNGKINKDGFLEIERKDEFDDAGCPFSSYPVQKSCGDWCSLFGEPNRNSIELCKKTLVFTKLTDERKSNDETK